MKVGRIKRGRQGEAFQTEGATKTGTSIHGTAVAHASQRVKQVTLPKVHCTHKALC